MKTYCKERKKHGQKLPPRKCRRISSDIYKSDITTTPLEALSDQGLIKYPWFLGEIDYFQLYFNSNL